MYFPAGNNCTFAMVVYTWDYGAIIIIEILLYGHSVLFGNARHDIVKSEHPVDVNFLSWCVLL